MFPMSELPKYVAFQSKHNGSYLRYVHGEREEAAACKFLESPTGGEVDAVTSPYTRFCVEPSREHDGLVHVRCCYNNKYWVPLDDGAGLWVIGTADEREEDLSKTSCTLFNPIPVNDDMDSNASVSIRFIHSQLGNYACMMSSSDMSKQTPKSYLNIANEEAGQENYLNAFTVFDLSQQRLLPKYVAFKSDNGKYLSAQVIEGHNYLQFASSDIGDPTVMNTTITNPDGTVRIKSNYFGKFWRRSPINWIWADSDDTSSNNRDTLFKVIKVNDYYVALRNLGNDLFCKRFTIDEVKANCLSANIETISGEAKLQVEETVLSREISDVDFHVSQAKIYGRKVLTLANARFDNCGSSDSKAKLTLAYKDTEKSTWDSTVGLKLGVETTIKTGVPFIAEGSVTVKTEFSGSYKWGSTIEKTTEQSVVYEVTVPPKTKLTVSYIATQGTCDVPFSYRQQDLLTTGEVVTYDFDDGLYTGVNCYDLKYETKEENI